MSTTKPQMDVVLDDSGLRSVLGLPPDADLAYYRDRCLLPYLRIQSRGKVYFRYVTYQVGEWIRELAELGLDGMRRRREADAKRWRSA